jgi:type IV pilus assembly protein PilA
MRQQKPDSYSILLDVCIALLKVGGGLLLVHIIIFIVSYPLFVAPLFFSFGFKDKQVEILVGTSASMVTKSKQSEAKQYVGSMNRAQQAKFAEDNAFASSVNALGLGIKTETTNYKYSTRATQTAAFNYAVAKKPELKSYFGGVFLIPIPANKLDPNARDEMTTVTILCETEKRPWFIVKRTDEPDGPAQPIYQNGEVICGKGTTELSK